MTVNICSVLEAKFVLELSNEVLYELEPQLAEEL